MTRAQIRTERWLNESIDKLSTDQLRNRIERLGSLLDQTTSPKWYAVIVERYREAKAALVRAS
jgi:hypothetical protein